MKIKLFVALMIGASILASGCGSSSSNNDTAQIQTEEEAFRSFCLNNPNHGACQSDLTDARNDGFDDYFGQDGFDSRGDHYDNFNPNSGLCGCRSGYEPVSYGRRGSLTCGTTERVSRRGSGIYIRYSKKRNGKKRLYVAGGMFNDYSDRTVINNGSGTCYDSAAVGCRDDFDCRFNDRFGNGYRDAYCDRGLCVQ